MPDEPKTPCQSKKVHVDQDICIGCCLCTTIAAKTFQMNSDGKSVPINPWPDDETSVQMAIDSCPVNCISWQED